VLERQRQFASTIWNDSIIPNGVFNANSKAVTIKHPLVLDETNELFHYFYGTSVINILVLLI
jgi:hypothetical protein